MTKLQFSPCQKEIYNLVLLKARDLLVRPNLSLHTSDLSSSSLTVTST